MHIKRRHGVVPTAQIDSIAVGYEEERAGVIEDGHGG